MATNNKVRYDHPIGQADILRPVIVHYDGMSFRKCTTTYRGYRPTPHQTKYVSYVEDENEEVDDGASSCCMDKIDDILDIKELPDGKYQTELNIPSVFYKFVIGKQGQTRRMIENDTKSRVCIPRQGEEGPIAIQATTKRSLSSAKQRIEVIVWSNRQNVEPTHFIGIALHSDMIQKKVAEFKRDVLTTCSSSKGIEEGIFQLPIKTHLTLAMLRLLSDNEQQQAILQLEKIVEKYKSMLTSTNQSPISIVLNGIDCMNDDHSTVNVLYAKVRTEDNSQVLQTFADSLLQEMLAQIPDFVKDERRTNVKLHATVMNSGWRQSENTSADSKGQTSSAAFARPPRRQTRISFDATAIFKDYDDYYFGSCELTQVLLLDRRAKDENGFYKCTKSFNLC